MPATWRIESDLLEIASYIARDDWVQAQKVISTIEATLSELPANPEIGVRVKSQLPFELRKKVISEYPNYLIYYSANNELVRVLYVVHAARSLGKVISENPRD